MLGDEIEMDESCFSGKRKGKRDRGAVGKVPVLGLLNRGEKVYTKIIYVNSWCSSMVFQRRNLGYI